MSCNFNKPAHRQVFINLSQGKYEAALSALEKIRSKNASYAAGDTTIPFMENAIAARMVAVIDSLESNEKQTVNVIDSALLLLRLAKGHLGQYRPYGDSITFSMKFAADSVSLATLKELLTKNTPESFYEIGKIYVNRQGYSNKITAVAWFKKSVEAGNAKGKTAIRSLRYFTLTDKQKKDYWASIVDNTTLPGTSSQSVLMRVQVYDDYLEGSYKGIMTGIPDYFIGRSGQEGACSHGPCTSENEYFTSYKLAGRENGQYTYLFYPYLYYISWGMMSGFKQKPVIVTTTSPLPQKRFGGIIGTVKAPSKQAPCIKALFGYFSDRKRTDGQNQIPEAYFEDAYSIDKYFSKRIKVE